MSVCLLIAGAAGLIGTSIVSALDPAGAAVVVLDLHAHDVDQGDFAFVREAVEGPRRILFEARKRRA